MKYPVELNYLKLFFTIRVEEDLAFPEIMGSRFRGLLGKSMHDLSCEGVYECNNCPESITCPYANLFKPEVVLHNTLVSPPFVIFSDNEERFIKKNQRIEFTITILGKFSDYYTYFIEAIYNAQNIGLGRDNVKFKIDKISVGNRGNIIYRDGNYLTDKPIILNSLSEIKERKISSMSIELLSPVQLRRNKKVIFRPSFEDFLAAGRRRINMINRTIWKVDDFEVSDDIFNNMDIEIFHRPYGVRKIFKDRGIGHNIKLSGIIGKIYIKGDDLSDLYTFFKALEILHIGSKVSYGLGKLKINYEI